MNRRDRMARRARDPELSSHGKTLLRGLALVDSQESRTGVAAQEIGDRLVRSGQTLLTINVTRATEASSRAERPALEFQEKSQCHRRQALPCQRP